MELLTRLPEFDALDIEVAKNYNMVCDALFTHINKRIEVYNMLGDDLFSWTRERLKKRKSWTVNILAYVDGYPTIIKKKTIEKFNGDRDFLIIVEVEKSRNKSLGFRIQINGFLNWYAGQWNNHGKNEADVLFQLRDYERLKSSLEKLKEKFKVEIENPGSDYENPNCEENKAIGLVVDSTDALSRDAILHYHNIFKTKVLEPLFQLF